MATLQQLHRSQFGREFCEQESFFMFSWGCTHENEFMIHNILQQLSYWNHEHAATAADPTTQLIWSVYSWREPKE